MTDAERAAILALLDESSKALEGATAGLSEEEAARCPTSGGWTIREIIEHVATGEEQMFVAVTQGFRELPEARQDAENEKKILDAAVDRSRKFTSPEVSRPRGRFVSLADALEHFRACRARTVQYVRECPDDQRRRTVKHPLAGVVTGYEYLLILARHPARHAAQIRELRSAVGA